MYDFLRVNYPQHYCLYTNMEFSYIYSIQDKQQLF